MKSNTHMPASAVPPTRRPRSPARRGGDGPGRAYAGLAAEDRVAARRARFVAAGIELFGTQGFRGATVRGACAAAGLTDRYFYESFPGLEALLLEVFESLMRGFGERLLAGAIDSEAWSNGAQAVARQAALGYELWFDAVRDPRFARIVLVEVLGVSPAVDAAYEAAMREFAELTIAPLAKALPGLRLPAMRRRLLGRALVGAAVQVAKGWMTDGYRASRRDVVRTCVLVATGTVEALRREGLGG